jgi:hypothetical protein
MVVYPPRHLSQFSTVRKDNLLNSATLSMKQTAPRACARRNHHGVRTYRRPRLLSAIRIEAETHSTSDSNGLTVNAPITASA